MKRVKLGWLLLCALPLLALSVQAQDRETVLPTEALRHHLRVKTVCGRIVGSQRASSIPGRPTLLHMGKPYPEQTFTMVIWEADRGAFGRAPEELYNNRDVCVTGLIVEHRGKPQIVVRSPSQVRVQQPE